ncbi:MAG: cysteine synthase A [Kosmotoga sp.]|uniref:cysteine synthase A n=1 Tax=Kosmotoga sp. TaxID=1955248 RepID=UPI001D9210C3|nr:cysteine synthase A [Kosmotoga sp.]MBO8165931.1 cysteine synthase A [Kosmotoga sp.]MCD6160394.1 cysteine synthase A [Kosmotoga sp.]
MNIDLIVGNTPFVALNSLDPAGSILLKLEKNNPGGSVKDRAVMGMILYAKNKGEYTEEMTIVEPTSGNTGISIAMFASKFRYKAILVMPESVSEERRKVIEELGAEVILTDTSGGMKKAVEKAKEIVNNLENAVMLDQFSNPGNPYYHEITTGPEIFKQCGNELDAFVAGVGTGGTITGVGRALKRLLPKIKIIGVEPEESAVLSGGEPGKHKIQGIGAGFVPSILDRALLDDVITVGSEEAIEMMRWLHKKEGLLVGISSGANVAAAYKFKKSGAAEKVATVAPDHYERYLSIF